MQVSPLGGDAITASVSPSSGRVCTTPHTHRESHIRFGRPTNPKDLFTALPIMLSDEVPMTRSALVALLEYLYIKRQLFSMSLLWLTLSLIPFSLALPFPLILSLSLCISLCLFLYSLYSFILSLLPFSLSFLALPTSHFLCLLLSPHHGSFHLMLHVMKEVPPDSQALYGLPVIDP